MAVNKRKAETLRAIDARAGGGQQASYAKRMMDYRERAEKMKQKLRGRQHSDSALLIREDRSR